MGLTHDQFASFMEQIAVGNRKTAYATATKIGSNVDAMNRRDYAQLQLDLVEAGYNRNLYNPDFTLNPKVDASQDIQAGLNFQNAYPDTLNIPNEDLLRLARGDAFVDALKTQKINSMFVPGSTLPTDTTQNEFQQQMDERDSVANEIEGGEPAIPR